MANPIRSFDIESCRDLYNKLDRELERLRNATRRDDQTDHALNFAISAWHMTDWTWASACRDPQKKVALAKLAGIPPGQFNKDSWARHMAQNPNIAICQGIATAAKHVGADMATFETGFNLAAVERLDDVSSVDKLLSFDDLQTGWTLKVVEGTERRDAIPIFERVLQTWTDIVYGLGLD